MIVRPLPANFNPNNLITPPVYTDHYLYAGELEHPYACPAFPAGIGLLLTAKGTAICTVNDILYRLSANDVFFINRGSRLAIKTTHAATPLLLFFHSTMPDLIQNSLQYSEPDNTQPQLGPNTRFDSMPFDFTYLERLHTAPDLHARIVSLIDLGLSCSSFAALKADMLIRSIFEQLLKDNQHAYATTENIKAVKASTRLELFKRISQARDWMDTHYHTNISLEEIAAEAAMNSQHFLRMFKQAFQITPHQYLTELRLNKAKALLTTTDLTISEICEAIGFESVFSFSTLFKTRFGSPPTLTRTKRP